MKKVSGIENIPPYMQQGSSGPLVSLLTAIFAAWESGQDGAPSRMTTNGHYGRLLAEVVDTFQYQQELERDGHLGPQTRKEFKKVFGFSFEQLAGICPPGDTVFIQPDGSELSWSLTKSD